MPANRTQIWAAICDTENVLYDLVAEVWGKDEDDDAPNSTFVASQGQSWLDHDFMETLWAGPGTTLSDQFAGAYNIEIWGDAANAQIASKGLQGINGLIVIGDCDGTPQIAAPRDAEGPGWTLIYLGRF